MRPSGLFRRFLADREGSIAVVFALALIPLLGLIGAAVDYSRATVEREKIQRALDSAVLAVNRQIGKLDDDELRAYAQEMFDANVQGASATLEDPVIDAQARTVTMTASAQVETTFLKLLKIDPITVEATAQSVTGSSSMEIALVLDNSGSMGGSRISTLRQASQNLVRTMFGNDPVSDEVKFSIVPFSGAVNIGTSNVQSSWMDYNAQSPIHQGMFASAVNRFDLYEEITNRSWEGCVEVRPSPYHVTDDAPSITTPATLFVPTFAPDEPDGYDNSYMSDASFAGGVSCFIEGLLGDAFAKLGQVCKYKSVSATGGKGPGFNCDSEPITPLTNVKSDLLSAIGQMQSNGFTNILEGVMWGWRTLSPGEPFSEGAAYDAENNNKFMIVMTDGANTVPDQYSSAFDSSYTAFGYADQGRLGSNHSNSKMVSKMNDYTLSACTNAKAAGIKVFTIAFDLDDDDTVEMLGKCASGEDYAFTADSTSDLEDTFEEIGGALGQLRIGM